MKFSNKTIIIIGSGIAGLYSAIKLNETTQKDVLLVTKSTIKESSSRYAQGGIVGVLPENNQDSVELHVKDTLMAGAGLTDPDIAKFISQNSADAIKDLICYGVDFDKSSDNTILLTLEAAHSVRRILHAGGDTTGKEIESSLAQKVQDNPGIDIYQKTQAVELLIDSENNCKGVILYNCETGEYETVFASIVIIATGGVGQVYGNTTNPEISTGDGIALAYRAGAVIQDMEFVQFHPTAMINENNDTRFLISESVRGEGARLRNLNKEYFTDKYNSNGDLASRDIVTRAIFFEMRESNTDHVLLDLSSIASDKIIARFPNIIKVCKDNGIDIFKDMIPVSPSAHYIMGGIKIALNGTTSIPGLFAIGEASCVSFHGANRLASNSLLECVVVPAEMVKYINTLTLEDSISQDCKVNCLISLYEKKNISYKHDISDYTRILKNIMWKKAGIIRNEKDLKDTLRVINELKLEFDKAYKCDNLQEYELRNLLIIAELIVRSAIQRKESRGAHFREDFPEIAAQSLHSYISKNSLILSKSGNECVAMEFCN